MTRPAVPRAPDTPPTADGMHDLRVTRYGFLLLNDFSLIALAAAVDPLRIANMIIGRKVYEYELIGVDHEVTRSSDGIRVVPDTAMADGGAYDAVFVVGPNPIPKKGIGAVLDWLRLQARHGVALGGLDTGSYFLARAGLLNGYRCTIHWEDQDALVEQFPRLTVSNRLYEADRDRYTCSGGIAPLDLMVHLLGAAPGSRSLAARVLELLVAERRSHEQRQRTSLRQYMGRRAREARRSAAVHGEQRRRGAVRGRDRRVSRSIAAAARTLVPGAARKDARAGVHRNPVAARATVAVSHVEAARRGVRAHRLRIDDAFRHAL